MHESRLFDEAAVPLLVLDPRMNRVLAANRESGRLFGVDAATLQRRSASALFGDSFMELLVVSDEALCHGSAWSDRLVIAGGDGPLRVEASVRAVAEGEAVRLHLCLQDAARLSALRERSEAHQHYTSGIGHWNRVSRVFQEFERENQLLLDAAGEGIYGVDANGITTFVNPAAERILGYSSAELAGRNMHSMVHHTHADGSTYEMHDCPIFEAFRDGTVHTVEDDVFWSKTGQRIDVEYTSTPIQDNGCIVGAVIVFRDISQRKADRLRLMNALDEVEKLKIRLEQENAYLQEELNSELNHHQIVGRSPAVLNILQQIELVGPTDATVLIHGESGTGKELIARAIHDVSARSQRAMIRVNCAAVPDDLFESEFFGHVKGAFTGATADRTGRFELADGGTLFLDEVGEIPLHLQGKLLRVLQEQQFERIGDAATREVDVRIIAATNQDLKARVAEGRFREDLYFRLNVFPIESPPLRQRREDIPLLAQHFLQRASQRANKRDLKIPLRELDKLTAYAWPGNMRELENIIERHVILAKGDCLAFDQLNLPAPRPAPAGLEASRDQPLTEPERRRQEYQSIVDALIRCRGKVSGPGGAAELLRIKPTTLASRVKKYGLDARSFRADSPQPGLVGISG